VTTPSFFLGDIEDNYLDFRNDIELPITRQQEPSFGSRTFHNPAWDADTPHSAPRLRPLKNMDNAADEKSHTLNGLTVGRKVVHDRFGEGEIVALKGTGNNAMATIKFKNTGEKNLLLKYAILKML
jgi:DNA helicase-2/ATP-dependent DNA helicase PcrA